MVNFKNLIPKHLVIYDPVDVPNVVELRKVEMIDVRTLCSLVPKLAGGPCMKYPMHPRKQSPYPAANQTP